MFVSEGSIVERPTVFFLHYLGGSSREWARVVKQLEADISCIAIDLPGFGDAAQMSGYTVAEMVASVAATVRANAPRRWLLAGHSMGAKVATVLARSAEDGAPGLTGFAGLVLLAGSPPSPEPMEEEQRQKMLGWFARDAVSNRADALGYVESNSNDDLDAAAKELAVDDALRANRAAWVAWLESGSKEDWSQRVGVLQMPALVIAGSDDENLGPDAQHELMVPHFAHVRSVTLPGAKHLLPLECASEVARLIAEHTGAGARDGRSPSAFFESERPKSISEAYRDLIASTRVSSGTRNALSARDQPDDPAYEPQAMSTEALAILRAVVDRVVPQAEATRIDLAARIDKQLDGGVGDGWRFADLPPDAEAYRAGLFTLDAAALTLHARVFTQLSGAVQDELLQQAAAGELAFEIREIVHGKGIGPEMGDVQRKIEDAGVTQPQHRLSANQMRAWFEDVRGDAVKLYVAHPQTLARMGYSGIANGGDGEPKSGFIRVGPGEREAWEPLPATDAPA